jgi:hypothetical protein
MITMWRAEKNGQRQKGLDGLTAVDKDIKSHERRIAPKEDSPNELAKKVGGRSVSECCMWWCVWKAAVAWKWTGQVEQQVSRRVLRKPCSFSFFELVCIESR